MRDIIDIYEESKFPALLEVLFFMVLVIDLSLAVWMTFMAPLHISRMPYLKIAYFAVIPVAYIFPIVDAVFIRKAKKQLLLINNIYLSVRVAYLAFAFTSEILYRMAEASGNIDKEIASSIIRSGIFNIACTLLFSAAWIAMLNLSKKIKYHIAN